MAASYANGPILDSDDEDVSRKKLCSCLKYCAGGTLRSERTWYRHAAARNHDEGDDLDECLLAVLAARNLHAALNPSHADNPFANPSMEMPEAQMGNPDGSNEPQTSVCSLDFFLLIVRDFIL